MYKPTQDTTTLSTTNSMNRAPWRRALLFTSRKKFSFHTHPVKLSLKLLAALVSAFFCLEASAATITVTNTNAAGAGSLRQAISDSSSGDTIDFDSSLNGQTMTLTSGELLIDENLTITGPGATLLAINGNAASRVFYVGSGTTVTISGLTITNGTVTGGFPANAGGGIYNNHATLTVNNCTVSANVAYYGGGIFNAGRSFGSATLTVNNTTFSGNSAYYQGGGIFNDGSSSGSATLTLNNSTLSGNSASTYYGGGIDNHGEYGSAALTLNNITFSGNSASDGGGIFNDGYSGSATVDISDTILNAGGSGGNISNPYSGTVTSHGYNLSSDGASGFLTATGDQINTDPKLGPLESNGGPTFTHALQIDSPAIDAGDPNVTPPPDYDQRGPGFPRVVNNRIDIGAFEVQPSTPTAPPAITSPADNASPNSRFVALAGTGTPGDTVDVIVSGLSFGSVLVDSEGKWEALPYVAWAGPSAMIQVRDETTLDYSNTITVHPSQAFFPSPLPAYFYTAVLPLRRADILVTASTSSLQTWIYGPNYTHCALYLGGDANGTPLVAEAVTRQQAGNLGEVRSVPLEGSLAWFDSNRIAGFRPTASLALSGSTRDAIVSRALAFTSEIPAAIYFPPDIFRRLRAFPLVGPWQRVLLAILNAVSDLKPSTTQFICSTLVWHAYFDGTNQALDISLPNNMTAQPGSVFSVFLIPPGPAILDQLRPYLPVPETFVASPKLRQIF